MDALLLLLAVVFLLIDRDRIRFPAAYLGVLLAFAVAAFLFRSPRWSWRSPRLRLGAQYLAMVIFVTAILALAGGQPGPLLNLYLLPVVGSALTLGRLATAACLLLVVAGRLVLSAWVEDQAVASAAYLARLTAELAPMGLVALLSTALASEIHTAKRRIRTLSEQDGLTGLLNLRAFTARHDELQRQAVSRAERYAVLMVDMDGLKALNDAHGHEAGNRAIVAVADALRRSTRGRDVLARYGGDEFVILLSGAGAEIAEMVSNRIRHNVYATTLELDHRSRRISVCVGAAVFPDDGRELRSLMTVADQAMYREKAWRRARGEARAAVEP